MAQDLISIVIPVYNRGWQLSRALDSIKNQTYGHYEVIICDDGSEEDIRSVIDQFSLDMKIIYLRIANSGGPARPRNIAINRASGSWIAFLDSDDWWTRNCLETMAVNFDQDVDLIYHPLKVKIEFGVWDLRRVFRLKVGHSMSCEPLEYMAKYGNPIATSGVVMRKKIIELIGGMDEGAIFAGIEDFDLWLKAANIGARFKFINQVLGYYWIGRDSISLLSRKRISGERELFFRHSRNYKSTYLNAAKLRYFYQMGSMLDSLELYNRSASIFLLKAMQSPNIGTNIKIYWKIIKKIIKMKLVK